MIFSRNHHIYLVIFACLLGNSSATIAQICGNASDLSIDDISLKWSSADETANSHGQPFVADLDNDGSPEVIVTNEENGTLNILDGLNNGAYAAISQASPGAIDLGFKPFNTVAIANLGIGNHASIVVAGYTGTPDNPDYQISLWSYDGTIMVESWKKDLSTLTTSNADPGTIGIADFDGTGSLGAQIYFANVVLNADGTVYAQGTDLNWPTTIGYGSLALDVLDVEGNNDGVLELITAGKIWSVNAGSLTLLKDINDAIDADASIIGDYYVKTWRNAVPITESRVMISAADYDLDGNIELIFPGALGSSGTDATAIFQWDPENNEVKVFKTSNNHSRGAGRIAIGDTDGDGGMNALFVSGNTLYNLNENFQQQWNFTVTEGNTTGYGGVTLYDFNGDGKSEILYRDREYFKAFKDLGTTAQTILEAPCKSFTREEYPIVADINNDGQAEICFSCLANNATDATNASLETANTPLGSIRVYSASNGSRWQPTRGVWNQHAYMNVNIVADDLSIPTDQDLLISASTDCYDGTNGSANIPNTPYGSQNKPLNMFMSQAPLRGTNGCPSFALPDLAISNVSLDANATTPSTHLTVSFDLTNYGSVSVSGILPITFYAGDPTNTGATKLNTENYILSPLDKNSSVTISNMSVIGLGGDFDWTTEQLYVVINESGTAAPITQTSLAIPESTNQEHTYVSAAHPQNNVAPLTVSYDPFTITLNKIRDNLKCLADKPNNGEVQVYYDGSMGGSLETIFQEDFENNSISNLNSSNLTDPSGNWTASNEVTSGTTDFWGVGPGRQTNGKSFQVNNGENAIVLETKSIDIASYTGVEIDVDAYTNNTLDVSGPDKDEIKISYSIDGGAFQQISTGTNLLGAFSYKHISTSGLSGNTLEIKIEITNNDANEYTEIDNIIVKGTLPAVSTQHTETSGFEFLWYAGAVAGQTYTSVLHTGSSYTGMEDGTYTIRARYIAGNVLSAPLDVTVARNESPTDEVITVPTVVDVTDCQTPNGSLQALITRQSDGSDQTADYQFSWKLQSEGVTTIGSNFLLDDKNIGTYKVDATSTITGCTLEFRDANISTAITLPPTPTEADLVVQAVTDCNDLVSGGLNVDTSPVILGDNRATADVEGLGLAFEGDDDYVQLPNGLVSTLTDFTFEAWFK